MLTPSVLSVVGKVINYSYSLNVVTFYWSEKKRRIELCPSRARRNLCFAEYCYLLICIFFLVEKILAITLFKTMPSDPLVLIMLVIYTVATLIAVSFGLTFLYHRERVINWANRFLAYFKEAADVFSNPEERLLEPKLRGLKIVLQGGLLFAVTQPVPCFLLMLGIMMTESRLIFMEFTFLPFRASRLLTLCLTSTQLVTMYIIFGICIVGFTLSVIYIYCLLFIIKEINPTNEDSLMTIKGVREPAFSVYIYRCLQVINDETNDIGGTVFPIVFSLTLCLSIIVNTSLIQYAPELHFGTVPLLGIAFATSLYQVLIYYAFGLMDEHSKQWMKSWKYTQYPKWGTRSHSHAHASAAVKATANRRQIMMKAYVHSCRPLSLWLGYWGPVKCITSLKFAGKILFYTGKVVLTLRNGLDHGHRHSYHGGGHNG